MRIYGLLGLPATALLLLAAHFARAQLWLLAAVSLGLVVVLAIPRRWAARSVQVALVAGGFEWWRTLAALVAARVAVGAPYARLALILACVALATWASALVFRRPVLAARFRAHPADPRARP
jgi:hypothetical protein